MRNKYPCITNTNPNIINSYRHVTRSSEINNSMSSVKVYPKQRRLYVAGIFYRNIKVQNPMTQTILHVININNLIKSGILPLVPDKRLDSNIFENRWIIYLKNTYVCRRVICFLSIRSLNPRRIIFNPLVNADGVT